MTPSHVEALLIRSSILAIIALVLFAAQSPPKLETYEDSEAYEVYAAILPSEAPWRDSHAKWLVIRAETTAYEMCLSPDEVSARAIGTAIVDYVGQNRVPRILRRKIVIDKPYTLLTEAERKAAFGRSPGDWPAFYQMYADSGGIIELSAVGFNPDKTVAVVYMGHRCGSLCGGGEFHVLQRNKEKWVDLKWEGLGCSWAS